MNIATSNPPRTTFPSDYTMTAFFMIVTSAMSISINSIYINTYIKRKNVPFKDILSKPERNMMWTSLGFGCANFLYLLIRLIMKWSDSKRPDCAQTMVIQGKDNKATSVPTTVAESRNKSCILKPCPTYEESYKSFIAGDKGTCAQVEYGTSSLMFYSLTVTAFCITTSVILIKDTSDKGDLTHLTNSSSDSNFIMTLVFAILSGFLPLVVLSYALGRSNATGDGWNVIKSTPGSTGGVSDKNSIKNLQDQLQEKEATIRALTEKYVKK